MDTNLVAALAEALSQRQRPVDSQVLLLVMGMIATAVSSFAGVVISYFANVNAKVAAVASAAAAASNASAADNTRITAESVKKTEEEVTKIHVAVNSERTAMLDEIRKLRDVILQLSEEKAGLKSRERIQELKDAATAPVVVTEAVVTTPNLTKADVLEIMKTWSENQIRPNPPVKGKG